MRTLVNSDGRIYNREERVDEFWDFVGKTIDTTHTWSTATAGSGTPTISIDTSKAYGEVVLEGNLTGDAILLASGTGGTFMFGVADNFDLKFRIKATEDDNHPAFGGSFDANNVILFYLSVGSNWKALTRSGGLSTDTDTGVAQDSDYHTFRIVGITGTVKFYIDDVLVATNTTNIPSNKMFIQVRLDLLQDGQTELYCDWIRYRVDRP